SNGAVQAELPVPDGGVRPLAFDGENLLVWKPSDPPEVLLLDSELEPASEPAPVALRAEPQKGAAVAGNGELYLAVWIAGDATTNVIRASRFSAAGEILDPEPIVLEENAPVGLAPVAIASNGTDFLVAWLQAGALGDE